MNNNAFGQIADLLLPREEHKQYFVIGKVSESGKNVDLGEITLSLSNFLILDSLYKVEPGARLLVLDYDGQQFIIVGEIRDDY